ncbi:FAA hydrolase family protein [Sphingomonas populi]|uniref:FAA hydrolase family protein n=1 Tax=Sphingomonas populi TaxID=2484750 RepID=A0A4Q6XUX3_9SPHN|nr:fumarylacetoacetate hydrolase family protein [Sphingomonas populi]RZF60669.1 FAA hydrolase family protein [Sphingomonas populi]
MKLAMFADSDNDSLRPAIITDAGVVDITALVPDAPTPQLVMQEIIDQFETLSPTLNDHIIHAAAKPLDQVRLGPPLPRPGKILNCIGNYWEHRDRDAAPLNMFLKNPDAVIGPGDVIRLPDFTEPTSFMHEAELALVFRGPSKNVPAECWRDAIFGYTAAIDVTARGEGRFTWKKMSWLGKSFDTFAPLGPCIVTADEIADPNDLHVRLWNNGDLRHNYSTSDMEHPVSAIVAFITRLMTMNSGDVVSCGTNHEGLGYLQDGERVVVDISGIGSMELTVEDPLKRVWERGVYMGENSTNHEAIRRNNPELENSLRRC